MIHARISLPDQRLETGQHIREFNFEIKEASFVALLGHNGSGKTTLLKTLAGLLPYRGEISFSSVPSFLPQHMPHPWGLTATEVVAMGKYGAGTWMNTSVLEEARMLLKSWELDDCAERDVATLSGGERQIVWLAQMDMQDTAIMLFDEPTQYLDLYFQAKAFRWMKEKVNSGKIIFCATHAIDSLYEMSGTMIHLEQSRGVEMPIQDNTVKALKEKLQSSRF